jgi:hypothetical protein
VFAGGRPVFTSSSCSHDASLVDDGDAWLDVGGDASHPDPGDASCGDRRDGSRTNVLICRPGPRTTDPGRVIGAKPAEFAYWLFDLLGARPGDTMIDLFPGSGTIGRAWAAMCRASGRTRP